MQMAATVTKSQERPAEGWHSLGILLSRNSQALSKLGEHSRQKGSGKGLPLEEGEGGNRG